MRYEIHQVNTIINNCSTEEELLKATKLVNEDKKLYSLNELIVINSLVRGRINKCLNS